MGQRIATLEIELGMETGKATADIAKFGGVVDKMALATLKACDQISDASKGMVDVDPAVSGLNGLADAVAKTSAQIRREYNQIERAGEKMSAQLDRQISQFGKTREELRAMAAETAAMDARRVGQTDLAARIESQEAALQAMERSAAAARQAANEETKLAAASRALKASIDPVGAALDRVNAELAQAQTLYERGAISGKEYGRAQEVLMARLREAEAAHTGMSKAVGKNGFALTQLTMQGNDVATMFAMGAPPMQIFASQAGQVFQVVQMAEGGLMGLARAAGAALLPFAPLIIAAGALVGGLALLKKEWSDSADLKEYAAGLGLTKDEMAELGAVSVTAGDMLKGLWRTIDDGLGVGDVFSTIKRWAIDAFSTALGWVQNFAAAQYAFLVGTGKAVISLGAAVRHAATGDFAGAWETLQGIPAGYAEAFDQAKGAMSGFFGAWRENALAAARERLAQRANELIDKRLADKSKADARELGTMLGDVLSGALITKFAQQMMAHPLLRAEDVFSGQPTDLREQMKAIEEQQAGERRLLEEKERYDREARDRALKTAYDVANIVGGGVGDAIAQLANALDRAFPELTKQIGESLSQMGGGFSDLFKTMGAGFQIGSASAGIMKGLGITTSTTGAEIGGALGSAFGGPVGAIAGSILGGVVGGLFKSVKKASATVEIIAGDAMLASLSGNSGKLMAVAEGLAGGLIGGLTGIADELGGLLGDGVRISIGQRKDTYRVDTMGLGRTKNMPSFETEAEAVEYAIQQAIMQGAITGLRAGTEALLKGKGDLETQLQKALAFEGVFRDLNRYLDPVGAAVDDVTKQFEKLRKIFAEAGASADDYAKLEQLFAIRRDEAIAQATKADAGMSSTDLERLDLERQLLQLEGKTSEIRARELAELAPSNRAIQERIYALQDEATAAQAAAALAQERAGIERTILQLQGNTAALRAIELDALDPSNRALQERVYALQDEAAAAAKATAIANERSGLERQWLELTGNTAALRARELAELDPSNRALQAQIWVLQDQQQAAQKAAAAAKELGDAWRSAGDSLMDEVKRIRALDGATAAAGLAGLQAQFDAATSAARRGDVDATRSLPGLSRALLDVAAETATTSVDLARMRGMTAASLEQTYRFAEKTANAQDATVSAIERGNDLVATQQSWWSAFAEQQAAQGDKQKAANEEQTAKLEAIEARLAGMAEDARNIGATLASGINKVARFTDNVTRGGDAVIVEVDNTVTTKAA